MKCSSCQVDMAANSKFCSACGQQQQQQQEPGLGENDAIRKKLSQFRTITKSRCLECGYSGDFGVTGVQKPSWIWGWWIFEFIISVVTLPFNVFGFFLWVVVFIAINLGIEKAYYRKRMRCPSCDKDLLEVKRV